MADSFKINSFKLEAYMPQNQINRLEPNISTFDLWEDDLRTLQRRPVAMD